MNRFAFGLLALALVASAASAGPFGRRKAVAVSCPSGNCAVTQTQTHTTTTTTTNTSTSSAQGVANLIVVSGRFRHWGGYNGYEGIGMGPTPEAALRNCCFFGRFQIADVGYAQKPNGSWVAVARYR
jgi:hypothetical protein